MTKDVGTGLNTACLTQPAESFLDGSGRSAIVFDDMIRLSQLLPWQFLEFVEKIEPKMVLIENVAGMRQNFVKHNEDAPFEQLIPTAK